MRLGGTEQMGIAHVSANYGLFILGGNVLNGDENENFRLIISRLASALQELLLHSNSWLMLPRTAYDERLRSLTL